MNKCEGCYCDGRCWACIHWLECHETKKKTGKCFECDEKGCPKEKTVESDR